MLSSWDGFKCENLNQMCSRILLSVHRKASRLAVLGDLGRYPLAVRSMAHCLNYRQCLASKPANSLLGRVVSEMTVMAQNGQDCWLTRAKKMAELLQTPNVRYSNTSGRVLLKHIQCKFQIFWRDEITSSRLGPDGEQHNKLLTYSSFKSHFSTEPFITMVRNRNQRCHLSRLRVSAHRLACETQRYSRPPVPRDQRYCKYCPPVPGPGGQAVRPVDDECHCLTSCIVGREYRPALYDNIASRNGKFTQLCFVDKFKTLVCPISPTDTKQVSRFLDRQFSDRNKIDLGV